MKVQRIFTTLSASIDRFVGSIENHEAVADALLSNLADAAARIRLEQASNDTRRKRLAAALEAAGNDRQRWQERAVRVHAEDPEKALACVQQLERAEARYASLEARLNAADRFAQELAESLAQVETELEQARGQTQQLKVRRACADAREAVACDGLNREFGALLQRWERSVLTDEYRFEANRPPQQEPLAAEFERAERREALEARLQAMVEGDRDAGGAA